MFDRFKAWCAADTAVGRLTRTIFQGVIGVFIANIDMIVGTFELDTSTKTVIVALCMVVLSAIQKQIGTGVEDEQETA